MISCLCPARHALAIVAFLALFLAAPFARAQSTWLNTGSGSWDVGTNWSDGSAPNGASVAVINTGAAVVSTGISGTYNQLSIGSGSPTVGNLSITGGSLAGGGAVIGVGVGSRGIANVSGGTWNNPTLLVGYSGTGVLNISGGLVAADHSTVGLAFGTGTVTVSGGTWNTSTLLLGSSGTGVLNISSGAVTSGSTAIGISGGAGTVNMTGGVWTSTFLTVGETGDASVTLNGATVNTYFTFIGQKAAPGQSGNVTITSGTWTNTNDINVGFEGTGNLEINGSTVTARTTNIGLMAGSLGSVTVKSGTLLNSGFEFGAGELHVGRFGQGSLTIEGGTVQDITGYIGSFPGAQGSVTMSGGTWNNGRLYVGQYGSGTLAQSGGTISSFESFIGYMGGSSGAATFTGGTWSTTNNFYVGYSGTGRLTIDTGVSEGSQIVTPMMIVGYNGGSVGVLTVASGSFGVNQLKVGLQSASSGTMNINGGLVGVDIATFGEGTGSQGTLNVTSGTFTRRFEFSYAGLTVGAEGTGALNVDGGLVDVGVLQLGSGSNGVGSLNLTSGTVRSWTFMPETTYVGYYGSGTVNISGANSVLDGHVTLGEFFGSDGTLVVSGGTLAAAPNGGNGTLIIGKSGTGAFILNDGTVNHSGRLGAGFATVNGGTWTGTALDVGIQRAGVLTVNGGWVNQDRIALGGFDFGVFPVGSGSMTVTGGTVSTTDFYIGSLGSGSLLISGGVISATNSYIGRGSVGSATISSGTWQGDMLAVSVFNSGSLAIQGGLVSFNTGTLGGNGTINMNGGTAAFSNMQVLGGRLDVTGGVWSATTMTVAGSGTNLSLSSGLITSRDSGVFFDSTALVTGGTWNASRNFGLGNTAILKITGGLVHSGSASINLGTTAHALLTGGTMRVDDSFTIGSGTVTLADSGVLSIGSGTIYHGGALNLGTGGAIGTFDASVIQGISGSATVNYNHTGLYTDGRLYTGTLAVNKWGPGTTVLTGSNSYTEGTIIHSGTLHINGGAINHAGPRGTIFVESDGGTPGALLLTAGSITADSTFIANTNGSLASAVLNSGTWNNVNSFSVGFSGTGSYTQNAGSLSSRYSFVGDNADGRGFATLKAGTWSASEEFYVGFSGTGALTQTGGSITSGDTLVGALEGGHGSVTMTGGSWSASDEFSVGASGTGVFTMSNGLVNAGTNAYIGRYQGGNGVVTINSGTWSTTKDIYIADSNYSSGELNILGGRVIGNWMRLGNSGTGTLGKAWIESGRLDLTADLEIGSYGDGQFSVDGGQVNVSGASILGRWVNGTGARRGTGHGFASVAGGTWTTDALWVGYWGTGELTITGGLVSSDSGIIGNRAETDGVDTIRGSGTVTISSGTWSNREELVIGDEGEGTLNVTDRGVVRVGDGDGVITIARQVASLGTLNIGLGGQAGTIEAAEITRGETTNFDDYVGVVNINNTGTTTIAPRFTGSLTLNKYGEGTAILTGSSTYTEDTYIYNGTLEIAGGAIDDARGQLVVGVTSSGTGHLLLTSGYVGVDTAFISSFSVSQGSLLVKSGTFNAASYLLVGTANEGGFTLDGGLVSSKFATIGGGGTAVINSGTWNQVDSLSINGVATLNGGVVNTGTTATVSNRLTMNGGTWNAKNLQVGSSGTGTLTVAGGNITSTAVNLGVGVTDNAVVNMSGGTWTIGGPSGSLEVAGAGDGTINLTGGQIIVHGTTTLAAWAGGGGELILSGSNGNRGTLETDQIVKGPGTGIVSFDGGVVRAGANQSEFFSGLAFSNVSFRGAYFDTNGYNIATSVTLHGDGGIYKLGQGMLTLNQANTNLLGGTLITGGTLAAGNNAALGTGAVRVENGTLLVKSGITIANDVTLAGGTLAADFVTGAALDGALYATSDFSGGLPDTTVRILSGTVSANATVRATFSAGTPETNSDILHLDGIPIVSSGTVTDLYVLELSMSDISPGSYLAWLNGEGEWVNAALGNTGNNATAAQQGFNNYFSYFQHGNDFNFFGYGTNLAAYIGAWGFTDDSVWVVLNHNSSFSIVPEPGTAALLILGAGSLLARRRRRS